MAAKLEVRDAVLTDADDMWRHLRPADFAEVFATAGSDVLGAIRGAVSASAGMCWTATLLDAPVLLLGCAPVSLAYGEGSPWLLGTTMAERFPGALTKIARRHIEIMRAVYPVLINHVDERNAASVRWLARLGFVIEEPAPYGVFGAPFYRFSMGA